LNVPDESFVRLCEVELRMMYYLNNLMRFEGNIEQETTLVTKIAEDARKTVLCCLQTILSLPKSHNDQNLMLFR
jgi:hypothetical protein